MKLSQKVVAGIRSVLSDLVLDPEGSTPEESVEISTRLVVTLVEAGGPGKISAEVVDEAYARFMAEFKTVGVWQGGKVVRAKLAKILAEGNIEHVWEGLQRLASDPNRPAPDFVPRPVTWLNQERWNDDPYPERGGRIAPGGSVLSISLDQAGMGHIEAQTSAQGRREIERRMGPSIMDDLRNGGAR